MSAPPKKNIRLRLRIDVDREAAIGPGKIALLEAILDTGSISAAGRKLGMSYRRAWLLVDDINARLKSPAVTRSKGGTRGGSSELTAEGRRLIDLYRGVEAGMNEKSRPEIRALAKLLAD